MSCAACSIVKLSSANPTRTVAPGTAQAGPLRASARLDALPKRVEHVWQRRVGLPSAQRSASAITAGRSACAKPSGAEGQVLIRKHLRLWFPRARYPLPPRNPGRHSAVRGHPPLPAAHASYSSCLTRLGRAPKHLSSGHRSYAPRGSARKPISPPDASAYVAAPALQPPHAIRPCPHRTTPSRAPTCCALCCWRHAWPQQAVAEVVARPVR